MQLGQYHRLGVRLAAVITTYSHGKVSHSPSLSRRSQASIRCLGSVSLPSPSPPCSLLPDSYTRLPFLPRLQMSSYKSCIANPGEPTGIVLNPFPTGPRVYELPPYWSFSPFIERESGTTNHMNSFQNVCFVRPFDRFSPEELRWYVTSYKDTSL